VRTFIELVERYVDPELCPYPEYKGKPYYSIKYIENGEEYVGYSSYSLQVMSGFLKKYFMSSTLEKQEQDRWRPCKERLPKEDGRYLITEKTDGTKVQEGYFCRTRDGEPYWGYLHVIAWRPLPEAYTEEENDKP